MNVETKTNEWSAASPAEEGKDAGQGPRRLLPRIRIDAFASSEDVRAAIRAAAGDRRASRTQVHQGEGGFAEAIKRCRETLSADVTIIEHDGDDADVPNLVEELGAYCAEDAKLIVIGAGNDVSLFRELIKMGVSDYLVRPIEPTALIGAIADAVDDAEDEASLGVVTAFLGARGGAGASTIAHNVAALIGERFEATSLLIDIDVEFGTAALQFDLKGGFDFADALKEREALDREILEDIVHWPSAHFGLLPAPRRPEPAAPPSEGATRHVVDQGRRLARYVTLDLPRGGRPWAEEALQIADDVVIVATADLPSLRNARGMVAALKKARPNDRPPILVMNKLPANGEPLTPLSEFERILGVKIAAKIPENPAFLQAEMSATLIGAEAPGSKAAHAVEALAARIVGREPPSPRRSGRGGGLRALFRRGEK